MKYKLNEVGGMVRYVYRHRTRCADHIDNKRTAMEAAEWLLDNGKPYKSDEYPGYPIAVSMNGTDYFFEGAWAEPKRRRVKEVALCP